MFNAHTTLSAYIGKGKYLTYRGVACKAFTRSVALVAAKFVYYMLQLFGQCA